MAINITFGGATIKRPGAYSTVDTANMYPVSSGGFKVLACIGVAGALSTVPANKVSYFNSPIEAKAVITSCEALDLMNIAWQHGADLIAFSPVAVVGEEEPAPTDTTWQNAIDLFANESVDGFILASTESAIQTKIATHCTLMSSVLNRKERRAFYGHATGLTVSNIVALQTALKGELGVMATPSVYFYNNEGEKVLKGSHYLASAYAGIWASQPSQEPITYKYVKFSGLEKIYTGTEITTLLEGHIAPVEYVRNKGYRIVQGITLSEDEDLTKQELSVFSSKVEMSQRLREYFEDRYVGKAGALGVEVTMYNDLISRIGDFLTEGLITGYEPDTVSVVKNGTAFTLQWKATSTLPINNFLITTHLSL